ncbi:MAG: rod shape-determining protein MreC [Clostridiales bacterium]|nr:rod shape-determining protein MreC [Clostridiales bacterium]MDY5702462.1 rod shape-determining protein MreC [Eubacteriales bacterium]
MKSDGSSKKPLVITLIAVILLTVLIIVTNGSAVSNWLKNSIASIVTPIEGAAAKASDAIESFFRNLFNTTDADRENERLRGELALYEQMRSEFEEMRLENERLSELLNYSSSIGNYELCTARVIAKSTGIWFRTLTLNAGTNKGVDVDMAVICSDGLVGRVTEVGYDWCKVTSIIDSSSTVPILVERTRDNCMARGILDGSSDEAVMELYYLPTDRTNLTPGDTVVTSGMGGIYPKGLIVGTVKEVMIGGEVSAIITPSVDFMHLEEVAVILGEGAEQ